MFGKILGELISLPVKMVNVPIKIIDKTLEAAFDVKPLEEVEDVIDSAAQIIEDSVEESIDGHIT